MKIVFSVFIFLFFALYANAQTIEQLLVRESYGYDNWGSSFKATKSGEIYRIDVYASGLASVNSNLLIYKGAVGSGSYEVRGMPFYEQNIDVDSYTGWTSIFLNTPQTITQDSMYTFIVETTAGVWGIDSIDAYTGGGLIIGYGHDYSYQTDLAFRIWEGPVTGPPTIISQPATKTICEGLPAQFQFNAGSTMEISFSWQTYINGLWTNITDNEDFQGTQTRLLTVKAVKPSLSVPYRGVSTNIDGTSYTDSAILIYKAGTFVEKEISDKVFCKGEDLDVPLTVRGFNLSYQWKNDLRNLDNQTKDTLHLTNMSPNQSGAYYAVVTGDCGVDSTWNFNLLIKDSTEIVAFPKETDMCIGVNDSIKIQSSGYNLNYQWYKNNVLLDGDTGQSLIINNAQKTDEAYYKVQLTGDCGIKLADSLLLNIHELLVILENPVGMNLRNGESAYFKVKASGSQISYRWRKDGLYLNNSQNIKGTDSDSLSLSIIDFTDEGSYDCEINSFCNSDVSGAAFLGINTTGIQDQKNQKHSLYPNPVEDILVISGPEGLISVEIFDIQGKTVMLKENYETGSLITVNYLNQGVYVLKIQSDKHLESITMLKK